MASTGAGISRERPPGNYQPATSPVDRVAVRVIVVTLALAAGSGSASAGLVFSEAEVIEAGTASAVRQVRRVFAQAGQLKAVFQQSADALFPEGAYLLVADGEAVLVDPARSTIAPVIAADMHPVPASAGEVAATRRFSDVRLELQMDERGPTLLGLPTWHYVYLLSYRELAPGESSSAAVITEERHEFWAAALPEEEAALSAWRELRVAEDGGAGFARREIREAVAQMYERGFFLRHVIERRDREPAGATETVERERIAREVTAVSREDIAAAVFEKPAGFSQTEFLVPGPDEAAGPGLPHRGKPGDSGYSPPASATE